MGLWLSPLLCHAQTITEISDEDYKQAIAAFSNENIQVYDPILLRLSSCHLSLFRCLHLRIIDAENRTGHDCDPKKIDDEVKKVEQSASGIADLEEKQHLAVLVAMARATGFCRGFSVRDDGADSIGMWSNLANGVFVASEAPRIRGELAYAYLRNSDTVRAEENYRREVELATAAGQEAYILHGMIGIGLCYKVRQENVLAVSILKQVIGRIEASDQNNNRFKLGMVKGNLGAIYKQLGQYDIALKYYESARQIKRLSGLANSNTIYLDHIASIYRLQGHYKEALRILRKDYLPFTSNPAEQNMAYKEIALNLEALGEFEPALLAIDQAIEIRNMKLDFTHIGEYWAEKGNLLLKLDRINDAYEAYLNGSRFGISQHDAEAQWKNLYGIFCVQVRSGQPDLAIWYGKQAVNTLQSVRAKNNGLDKSTQRSFLEKNEATYKELADLLFGQGRLIEGQQVLAMLKEAEYFDFIQRNSATDPRKTQASFDGKEKPLAERYEKISDRLVALSRELDALNKKINLGLTPEEQRRKDALDADRIDARKAYDAFMVELKREFTQSESAGRSKDERIEAFGEKNFAGMSLLQETLNSLGHGAVVLHYLMTDKRLWILLTTPTTQLKREAAISEAELNKQIGAYREAIANHDPKVKELGKALYDLIIAPVADDLKQADAQTLMFSLDGGLRYLPMAALYDGKKYLAQRFRLAIYTSAATLPNLITPPKANWNLAGFGLTHAVTLDGDIFKELTSVKSELDGIKQNMEGTVKLDQQFTAKTLKNGLEAGSSVIHLSSHFVFKPGNQEDSFLLMGDDSKLTLAAIRDYIFTNVDLLTLSACQTAVGGGKDANGREVEGFGVQAQNQRAKGVIATLWEVEDQSTGQFMQLFYGFRQHNPGMTKAEAMQKAQLAFIEGQIGSVLTEVSRGWHGRDGAAAVTTTDHPYYWAPFILMGNWL